MSAATELEEVLLVLERRKLRPITLVVGSVRVQFGLGGPEDQAASGPPSATRAGDDAAVQEALRARARKLFGRTIPDDELAQMKGVI